MIIVSLNTTSDPEIEYRKRIFGFEELIDKAVKFFDHNEAESFLNKIMSWGMETENNILKQLCELNHEKVSAMYMNYYLKFSDFEFFFESMTEER